MRTYLMGMVVTAALALPAAAQQTQPANSFFTGVNPRTITMTPIDTSQALKTYNFNTAFHNMAQPKAFSLSNVFHNMTMPSWPPKIASAPILPKSQNQFQPNPIFGKNPFASPGQ